MDNTWFEKMEERIPRGEVRTRFAPSPTGYMHVGNLRTALYTWCIARHAHGKFLLRIEDTDQSRQVEGAVEVIYKTLRDCGLDHDEGPDVGGPVGPYVQTERRDTYLPYAKRLVERGHAYYCFCDKTESEEDSGDFTRRDDPCRELPPEEVQRRLDDQVLIKRDGLPTYNFANVVDDHLMGITHVVRGSEYLSSAPKYNLLYEGLGWDVPSYVHCSPVMRDAHNKMSKRHGDPSYEDLVAQGFLTEAIVNYVALLGWAPGGEREIFSINELAEAFDMSRISKSPAIFDIEKLTYFNSEYIKAMSPEAFARAAEPWIRNAVKTARYDSALIAAILQQRTEEPSDLPEKLGFFDTLPEYDTALYIHKKSKCDEAIALDMLKKMRPRLAAVADWTEEAVRECLIGAAAEFGCKNALVMWPVRIAVSGEAVTPGGAVEICHILGRAETLARIDKGIKKLEKMTE